MRITLTKNIELMSAQVYMRFQKQEERKDIQEYLNGKKHFEWLIENRIKDYLKNIGIFDEQYQITKYGSVVKETGKMYVSEEGKYQIWFTENDSLFGNKIFFFRRIQPNINKDELNSLNIRFEDSEHFLLPTNDNPFTKLTLKTNKSLFGKIIGKTDTLQFYWIWDNLENSYYTFRGQIGKSEKTINIKNEQIPTEKNIKETISEILPDWNKVQNRYAIRFDFLNDENKILFVYKNYKLNWKDFEVHIQNLPLMPYNKEEAKKWRNWLLNEELKKEYFNKNDFEAKANELNEKEALAIFCLNIPGINDFIQITNSKKVFWHLQAPLDLNPNTKIKLPTKQTHIELKQGDKVSFVDIITKMNIQSSNLIVYYDKYVVNDKQQKATAAFLEAIKSPKKIIITDLTPRENSSDFIQKNVKEIKIKDCKAIFKAKPPHDRYLISVNHNEITIWNISNSVDYISFQDRYINKNTIGTIRQSVVFTPISKEILDKDLLNLINNESKNGD